MTRGGGGWGPQKCVFREAQGVSLAGCKISTNPAAANAATNAAMPEGKIRQSPPQGRLKCLIINDIGLVAGTGFEPLTFRL